MKKKPLIPFRMMPASWGLSGPAFDEAEAAYNLSGEDLERRLNALRNATNPVEKGRQDAAIDLRYEKITAYQHDIRVLEVEGRQSDPRAKLDVEFKHSRIGEYEYSRGIVEIENSGTARETALVALDLRFGRLTPYQHDLRLLEIEGRGNDPRAKLDLEFKHNLVEKDEYDRAVIDIELTGTDREIALLDLDLARGKLTRRQHAKAVANVKGEPWVGIVGDEFDLAQSINGFAIELDWNDHWIAYLRMAGFVGATPEEVIDQWFTEVCRAQVGNAPVQFGDEFEARRGV